MSRGEAYDVLNVIRVIDLRILRLMSRKQMLESCLYPSAIRYDLDKVQGSKDNFFEKITSEISVVEMEINDLKVIKITKAAELEKLIDQVSSEECQTILYMRYIAGKRVNDIAESMSYSPDWVYKKLRRGVAEVGKILEKEEQHG